jgi:DNA polymerase-4
VAKIIHVDMDAFYASVEQRDRPELRGRPVVVGGDPGGRGVVATCSYEARAFGIHSAMSAAEAYRRCPDAAFVRPNMARYVAVSRQIRQIFLSVTPLVEPVSLDEAYLDVTENRLGEPLAREVARWVKRRIVEETGLTASAGVASTKLLAKIASDLRKPDGLVVIPPERARAFLATLPVRKLWGVGPVTSGRLERLGFVQVGDLAAADVVTLERELGRFGRVLHHLARGEDLRAVTPNRAPKSRGAETTLAADLTTYEAVAELVRRHAVTVADGLARARRAGRTVTLKVRYSDFATVTRSRTLLAVTADATLIADAAIALLALTEAGKRPVRLVGVAVSGFPEEADGAGAAQLDLPFEQPD